MQTLTGVCSPDPTAGKTDDWSLSAPHLSLLVCLVNPEHRNKSVRLQCSSRHFLGTEILTALLPEGISLLLFFSGILCLEMEGELKIQRVLFSTRFSRNGSVGPRKLLKPETDFPRQLISLPATIPARARCLNKQNLHAQFPDHSSQTTEDDDHIFFFFLVFHHFYLCVQRYFQSGFKKKWWWEPTPNNFLI